MNTQTPIISLKGVNKWYGDYHALRDVSLDVMQGQKLVICGPSGSGKSTLIRCTNNHEQHNVGDIVVDGVELAEDLKDIDAIRQTVGMVFQSFNLSPHMTVLDNCTFGLRRVLGVGRAEAEKKAMDLLSRVQIAEQAQKYPGQLSGGQQQRVAIARALTMDPKVMLFDEPTSALDPEMISEVMEVMKELALDGMTMICVTHEIGFAREVADQIIFMEEGSVIEDNDPVSFFETPKTDRAKRFLNQIFWRIKNNVSQTHQGCPKIQSQLSADASV